MVRSWVYSTLGVYRAREVYGTIAIARRFCAKIAQWGSKYEGQGSRLAEWALIRANVLKRKTGQKLQQDMANKMVSA